MEKPILFNTEMVKAILENQKTQTRRIIKPQPKNIFSDKKNRIPKAFWTGTEWVKPPYQPGDILYARETWCSATDGTYRYKAGISEDTEKIREAFGVKWHPSIHMPKSAARIFLKVTGVRAERVQYITEDEAREEGINMEKLCVPVEEFKKLWDSLYAAPQPVKEHGTVTHFISYPWECIKETKIYMGLPWIVCGNPWVWVIEFEREEK